MPVLQRGRPCGHACRAPPNLAARIKQLNRGRFGVPFWPNWVWNLGARWTRAARPLTHCATVSSRRRQTFTLLCEGCAGQATISSAQFRRALILCFPPPHHAARSLASEEMPSHLVMQAREKHAVQHVFDAALRSRIGTIEGKWSFFPTKADHRAPPLHHGVFFSHQHWKTLHLHDDRVTASIDASAGSPLKLQADLPREP